MSDLTDDATARDHYEPMWLSMLIEAPRAILCLGVPAGVVWICWLLMGN